MKHSRLSVLLSSACALTLGNAMPGFAQDATPAEEAESDRRLEAVTVTAQRREENLQDVPLSVTAATGEALERRNISDLSKLDVITPGFSYGRSGIDSRPAMRGVRTENVGVNGDTTIGYFIDGIYQSRAAQATATFTDIERVEVQRGPQGTLYGRNTFGGNVAVITNAPKLGEYDYGASAQYSSFETLRGDAFVNIPLGEKAAFRFAAAGAKGDGMVENAFNEDADLFDNDVRYFRGGFRFQPTEAIDVTLRADLLRQDGNGGSAFGYKIIGSYYDPALGLATFNSTPLVLNTRPNVRDGIDDNSTLAGIQDLGIPVFAANDPYTVDQDYDPYLNLERKGLTADISWDLGPVTLRSITGSIDFETDRSQDSDFSRNQIAVDYQLTTSESLSQEFQLLSNNDGPLQYVAGVYFFQDELQGLFINQQLPPIIGGVSVNGGVPFGGSFYDEQLVDLDSLAYYGQATFSLTDRLSLTAGIRYTEDEKSFRVNRPAVQSAANAIGVRLTNAVPFDFDAGAAIDTQLDGTFDATTYRLGAEFDVSDDSLIYASFATGFRSGGFNTNTATAVQTFEPETVDAIELGWKNTLMNGALQLNLAAFFNQYEDLQEQRQVPVGATTASVIFNAAEAEAKGVEVEAAFAIDDRTTIGGTLSLLNAEYTDFRDAPIPGGFVNPITGPGTIDPARVPPGFNCRIVPNSVTAGTPNGAFGCDLSGNKIPYSPEYSGTIYGSTEFDFGGGTLTPYASVTFSAESFGQPFNTQLEKTDAYARVDVSLEWAPSERFAIKAFVDNATDEVILNRAVYGGGGALQGSWQPPRTAGLKVSIKN
jgi:iron complex outermembrane recepter protein